MAATFSVAEFNGTEGDVSPTNFLGFLHSLSETLNEPADVLAGRQAKYTDVLIGLSDQFIAGFPAPLSLEWHLLHEKIQLAIGSLDIIRLVSTRVEGVYHHSTDLGRRVFARLLNFCIMLEMWLDYDVPARDGVATPQQLADDAVQTTVLVLRTIGETKLTVEESKEPLWKIMRGIVVEASSILSEILTRSSTLAFPVSITLFPAPSVRDAATVLPLTPDPDDRSFTLNIDSPEHIITFAGTMLAILSHAIHPPLLSEWFLADVARGVTQSIAKTVAFCSSPTCSASPEKRVATLLRLTALPREFDDRIPDPFFQLLRYRIAEGPMSGWDDIDSDIIRAFQLDSFIAPPLSELKHIIGMLTPEAWAEMAPSFRALVVEYVRCCVPRLPRESVSFLQPLVPNDNDWASVHHDVAEALAEQRRAATQVANWRHTIQELTQDIIFPLTIDWMDGDEGLPEEKYAQRAIDDVTSRFARQLMDTDAASRVALAESMANFLCLAGECKPTPECRHPHGRLVYSLDAVSALCKHLFEGPAHQVTGDVKRSAFITLSTGMLHHCGSMSDEVVKTLWPLMLAGVFDGERTVRLLAGASFAAFLDLYAENIGLMRASLEEVFDGLQKSVEEMSAPVLETFLVTMGRVGRTKNSELLSHALKFLMARLTNSNPILKGTASMQLLGIADHHKKTLNAVAFPHFDQIAPFLVLQIHKQPELIFEACRLMNTRPEDFISVNLVRILPRAFALSDIRVVEEIARALNNRPSTLLLRHSAEILAHIFLLTGKNKTETALRGLLNVLRDSANQNIDLHSVVKSSIVQLIAQLVIGLGDEDEKKRRAAESALRKVEKAMMGGDDDLLTMDLPRFLKTYMLGAVTNVNDILRDGRGKIPVAMKRKILRSLGVFVQLVGPGISSIAPQIMATFQTMVGIPELAEVTLASWKIFLSTPAPSDIGPHIGPTSAAFVAAWPIFSPASRQLAHDSLAYIVAQEALDPYLDEVVDLGGLDELQDIARQLQKRRSSWTLKAQLQKILDRVGSDNLTVTLQSLGELKSFMRKDFVSRLASGDIFDPLIGQIASTLFSAACREGDGTEPLRLLAYECIGALGAVDPDRFELGAGGATIVMVHDFTNEDETIAFALHLIQDLLVGAFRSTSDIRYQSQLAYCIQELLKFCRFTPALVGTGNHNASISKNVRQRWGSLPKHVVETAAPLLESKFVLEVTPPYALTHPLYPRYGTYREWLQWWTAHLISRASGPVATTIFGVFRQTVRNKDVVVAHHLLPHLVLNVLLSGNGDDAGDIRNELSAVLEDQVDGNSHSSDDKKLLSAQVVFTLLDHLNKWVRIIRQDIAAKRAESNNKRIRNPPTAELDEQLIRVDSVLSNIDQHLMARAALKCKAYARSLMNFESRIAKLRERSVKVNEKELNEYYERLHEIYSHLDEPDGMEGISTLVLEPTLEHQIRQHESTGHWTSAQSCWEVRLQQSPDNIDFHLGLLRCLRNLGHYDTLRTHVRGVLTRNPDWQDALSGFQVESAWMVGAWDDVQDLVQRTKAQNSSTVMARVLLAMRSRDSAAVISALSVARSVLGTPISASGARGYRRSYEVVQDLHRTHELELIYNVMTSLPTASQRRTQVRQRMVEQLNASLSARLDSTLPTFRAREPILSMRRTAFALISSSSQTSAREIGRSWLASAKIARKAGQWQTAYSAVLQARQSKAEFAFLESAKLVKATGEPLAALQELEKSMRLLGLIESKVKGKPEVLDLEESEESKRMKSKAQVLRARWMNESERFETSVIFDVFYESTEMQADWESCHFHLGRFHDECNKNLSKEDQASRGLRMSFSTVKSFARAIRNGSKYVYQTVPRLLTIWLDLGENAKNVQVETLRKLNEVVSKVIRDAPVYKWYTAFPQIVSRIGVDNKDVYPHLETLILRVLEEYPKQALWLFVSVVLTKKATERRKRGTKILNAVKSNPRTNIASMVAESELFMRRLLDLCEYTIADNDDVARLSMKKTFPELYRLGNSNLIIPLQESLTASLPPTSSLSSEHQPFPPDLPTFQGFADEIDVMRSLAKPRKITITGSNGQIYMFLGKPKDDLRKDARLMDFNAILNKLLKSNSESRRRQLHIRTYGVVTLNEESGFIQWVPNTTPVRPVLTKSYDARRIKSWDGNMQAIFHTIKFMKEDKEAAEMFRKKILPMFPPLFHEWFIETFPEPSAWLASRLAYGRTAAVMSMVGFILGLGDRHCENILLDVNTGDVVHVDFNCLFEKGKALETPERVPFRLTQNIVDGLGVTGVEGVFRIACEVTLQLLRDNKDSLMSVLDAFVHDPLVDFQEDLRRQEHSRRKNHNTKDLNQQINILKANTDLRNLGRNALKPIERKLMGIYMPTTSKEKERTTVAEKEVSTSNLVQILIQEATELSNLAKMYPGWAAWH
ncbi:hypothetical protein MKEN_00456000 [Mycena kentingensis (nom. inval.)]|nr:hypothetical protein MKEN_00456000 [Mycena kentingensis (nom. inval.)]